MNSDDAIVRAVEQARGEVDPETTALFDFYVRLLGELAAKKRTLDLDPDLLPDPPALLARARAGRPALDFARLGLDLAQFGAWARHVRDLLATREPELALEADALDDQTVLELAGAYFDHGTTGEGPALDSILANALAPWLEEAAALILPHFPLRHWRYTYCPVCGGAPDFAALETDGDQRTLLCERCRTEWTVGVDFCVFCGEDDPEKRGYYSSLDDIYLVEVCDTCRQYLKLIRRAGAPDAPLAAERLLTPGLDLLAVQEGYRRQAGWVDE